MVRYRSLCTLMDSNGSLRVLIGPFRPFGFYWVFIDRNRYLFVLMDSTGSLWVRMCLCESLCILMDLYGFL